MDSRLKRGGAAVLAAVAVALLLHWFGPSCTTSNETMTVNGDHLLIEGDLKNWSGKEANFLGVYDLYGADGVWLGNAVGMDGDGVRFENAGLVTRFRLKGAVSMAF